MFQSLFNTLESGLLAGALAGAATAQGLAASGLAAGISLYMLLASLAVLRGIAGDGFGHIVTQGVKASLVWAALTGALVGDVGSLVLDVPSSLGASDLNIGSTADNYIERVSDKAEEIVEAGTAPEDGDLLFDADHYLSKYALAGLSIIPIGIAYIFAAVIVVIGLFLIFALAITASFAPLFVALILYDSTRGMFFTWLGAALGYGFSIVVIGIVAAAFLILVPTTLATIPTDYSGYEGVDRFMAAVLALTSMAGIGIVGILFLFQAQGIGQALGGGGGGSGASIAGALIPSRFISRALSSAAFGGAKAGFRGVIGAGKLSVKGGMATGRGAFSAARALADSNSRTRIFRAAGAATLAAGRMARAGV